MKIECTIKSIGEHQSGVNASTGNTWHKQTIEVEWKETRQNREGSVFQIDQSLVVGLWGDIAKNFNLSVGQNIVLDISLSTHEYGGRKFNDVRSNFIVLR